MWLLRGSSIWNQWIVSQNDYAHLEHIPTSCRINQSVLVRQDTYFSPYVQGTELANSNETQWKLAADGRKPFEFLAIFLFYLTWFSRNF